MFKYHFKIICRNLLKNKLHLVINIAGFAIGISSFILILLYVNSELTFDKFHSNYNRIYKVAFGDNFYSMAPFASVLKDKIPEIEKIVRVDDFMGGGKSTLIKAKIGNETKTIEVKDIIYADSTFFDVFSFRVIQGNAKTSLTLPNSIVLTKSTASKIFGKDNPIGKTIEYIGANEKPRLIYTVSAIIEDIPNNSSIKFNGIVSFTTLKLIKPAGADVDEDYNNWTYDTYVLVKNSCSVNDLTQKTNKIWLDHILKKKNINAGSESAKAYISEFVPLKNAGFYKNNKIKFIYLILLVGIIIIIIAVINFVNLSIAKSSMRTKEIGIKKITGSSRYDLIKQFIGETTVLTFIAAFFAMIVVYLLMPLFNKITGKSISFNILQHPTVILLFISGSILIGIIAGIYPALYLSAFKPIAIIKNGKTKGNKNKIITQSLIIFQFVISVALIISTVIITKQVKYMRTENVGFNNKQVITCQMAKNIQAKYGVFKQRLLQNPNIINIATSNNGGLGEKLYQSEKNEINGSEKSFNVLTVDQDFIKTIGLKIIEGRDFSMDLKTDKYLTVILNETAVNDFGLKQPLGSEIKISNYKLRVIGVVKDFHNESFQKKIDPLALWYVPEWSTFLSIRIGNNNIQETIQYIKKQWEEISPEIPFKFQFLDERYETLYNDENKFNLVIGYFSIIAILIACLGLFGLVTFSTESCIKEIGIRKVNGARVIEILAMLNLNFIKWVVVAFIIACPIAWYAMYKWLQNFAYKTELSWWVFGVAGIVAVAVAVLTVSWQSWRAATRNPVEALRYE
jgi:putative ABC transport system permease protein